MLEDRASVLLILRRDVLDRARVAAGKATTALKLPVSLQIVLRALIDEGLKRNDDPAFLASVEAQAKAVRRIRTAPRWRGGAAANQRRTGAGRRRGPGGRAPRGSAR